MTKDQMQDIRELLEELLDSTRLQQRINELEQQLKTAQADTVRYAADNLEAIGIDGVYVVEHDDLLELANILARKWSVGQVDDHKRKNLSGS